MRLDDLRPSDNVEDRRGEDYGGGGFGGFGGPRMIFGGGGLGLIVVLVLSLFFGVDPSQLLNGGPGPAPQTRQETGPRSDDADYEFARRIIGSAEDVWQPLLRQRGVNFTPATFTAYDSATPPAVAPASLPQGRSIAPATPTSIWIWPFSANLASVSARPATSPAPMSSPMNMAIISRTCWA
jgi:predicted metalloprotease